MTPLTYISESYKDRMQDRIMQSCNSHPTVAQTCQISYHFTHVSVANSNKEVSQHCEQQI